MKGGEDVSVCVCACVCVCMCVCVCVHVCVCVCGVHTYVHMWDRGMENKSLDYLYYITYIVSMKLCVYIATTSSWDYQERSDEKVICL